MPIPDRCQPLWSRTDEDEKVAHPSHAVRINSKREPARLAQSCSRNSDKHRASWGALWRREAA
jgi:hypothetical protein